VILAAPDDPDADPDPDSGATPSEVAAALARHADQAPVDVSADLTLTIESQPIRIESYTDLVVVDLPSVRVASPLYRGLRRHLDAGDSVLRTLDLTVEVRVDGTPVARVGSGARPRGGSIELDLPGLARAAVEAPIRFFS